MIGVFRLYLGQAWQANGQARDLHSLFDAVPEFLYRTSLVSIEEAAAADTPEARRACVRMAMTQAHALVLPVAAPAPDDPWTELEIDVARSGLRQRLPIVAVALPASPSASTRKAARYADAVVHWTPAEVACGIQGVVEAAAVEHRAALKSLEAAGSADGLAQPKLAMEGGAEGERRLPTAQIVAAFAAFRRSRGLTLPETESV
ncbi:MAG: hypothetical protein SFW09_03920 [Hyphomicrobiaceae bacterium]|nr:hypothetical protein [Hyphomicrobiaceae bacterium]